MHEGAVELLAFYVPFTLLAICIARLPWSALGLRALYVELDGDGGRLRGRRLLPVRDAQHLREPEARSSRTRTRRSSASTRSSGIRRSTGGSSCVAMAPSIVLLVLGRSLALVAGRRRGARRHLARPADLVLAVELRGAARRRDRRGLRRVALARARRGRARGRRARGHRGCAAADPALARSTTRRAG